MKLILKRKASLHETTIGALFHDEQFICFTLEDQVRAKKLYGKTAIPEGTYKVLLTHSPRFKRILPLLVDVPGFDGVRIHTGNTKEDTEGCILPGTGVSDDGKMITGSRDAFNILFNLLKKDSSDISITIIDEEFQ